jgi:two-component system, chemotaxis family, chemotaxis protein CheY
MKFCLIIDDSDVIRKVAAKIVEGMGHIPIEAATAEEALERCMSSMPDLILLDWHLPTMSAMSFLTSLKKINGEVVPQILYCVTEADPVDLRRASRAGISDFILKPFDHTTLAPKISGLVGVVDAYASA